MTARRQLTLAVAVCVAAAVLALFATSRTWLVETEVRAAPLPAIVRERSGGWLLPALPALALVALAGAGGLLATRGRGRLAVAILLVGAGLGMVASIVAGGDVAGGDLAGGDVAPGVGAIGWAGVCVLAGLAVSTVGAWTLRRGHSWPGMGTRYERAVASGAAPHGSTGARRGRTPPGAQPYGGADPNTRTSDDGRAGGESAGTAEHSGARMWEALDRGEDPTKG